MIEQLRRVGRLAATLFLLCPWGGLTHASGLEKIHPNGLQAALDQTISTHGIVGAGMAVYIDGRTEFASAGIANLNTGYTLGPDTLMQIGSVTKVLTTTLVMQLVDEGRVDLDAPFVKYIRDNSISFPKAFQKITVRMLLNHSNGINGDMFPQGSHDQEVVENAVRQMVRQPLLFRPGTAASYSNGGMVMAGYLVEQVLGIDWYSAVKERIFTPAGMDHAIVLPEEAVLYKTSIGHLVDTASRKPYPTRAVFMQISYAAAGATAMMTPKDLLTFGLIHLNDGVAPNGNRILSAKSAQLMRQPSTRHGASDVKSSWGLGWEISDGGIIQHGGGGSGVNALLVMHPASKFVAVMMTNTETGRAGIADMINPYIATIAPSDLARPALSAPSALPSMQPFVGTYEDVLVRYTIAINNGALVGSMQVKVQAYENFSLDPTPFIPLQHMGGAVFGLKLEPGMAGLPQGGLLRLEFLNPDKKGHMQHIAIRKHLYPRIK